jgi:hypothetical protein
MFGLIWSDMLGIVLQAQTRRKRCRVGKGGHETSIDASRRVRRAHTEQLNLPRDPRGHGAKSATVPGAERLNRYATAQILGQAF